MPSLSRYGPWALITGASAGIGECFARRLAAEGFNCVLLARREDRLSALAKELERDHAIQTRVLPLDLGDANSIGAVDEATKDLEIGLLINNAGFGASGAFQTRDAGRIGGMVDVNCRAVALLTHHFLPPMLERKKGGIVIVSSVLGIVPCPYEAVYGATKAFDLSFGMALWSELRATGVDCITVCPGQTDTEFLMAEGLSESRVKELYKNATPPDTIVRLALDGLGRRTVTGPASYHLTNFLSRILPRWGQAHLIRTIFERTMPDRIGL